MNIEMKCAKYYTPIKHAWHAIERCTMKTVILIPSLFIMLAVWVCPVDGREPGTSMEDYRMELLSRLKSMGHGYYTRAEWDRALSELYELIDRADNARAHGDLIELRVIQAMVYSDMRSDHQRAIEVLAGTLERYRDEPHPNIRRVYVKLAEVNSQLGRYTDIADLIEDFRKSRHYDPADYHYEGGWGREVPLAVTRPHVGGSESITVTTMQKFKQQARFAPGQTMPDFASVDMDGRPISLSDLRGQVVLVDFYVPEWFVWRRDLSNLKSAYRRYNPAGFEIIGIYMRRDEDALRRFMRANDIKWPQISGASDIAARYGIYGEARNFLIDRNGVIVGRDLRGSDLVEAIRRAI